MHEDTVPEKRPYLLQADAEALLGLLAGAGDEGGDD
jgi:hypothetical protein